MKLNKLLIALTLFLGLSSSANAVTLVAGNSYQLSGSITSYSTVAGYSGLYSLGTTSYFTVNFDNTISVVLNLTQADGDRATLRIDKLLLGTSGASRSLTAPAGVKVFPSGCKDIGDFFPVNNPAAFVDFTIAGSGHNINTTANTFNLFTTSYYNQAGTFLGRNNVSFSIGSTINTQVPEPMTISLVGMGLLGGALRRKKRAA